jgi:hypothetical protein
MVMNQAPRCLPAVRARAEGPIRTHNVARYSGCYVDELRVTEETNSR